jgi:mannose-6-phosphate isomerase-like protein (cupin superfamily)
LANRADARLEPLLIKLKPGEEEPHFRTHDADSLIYVLEGEALIVSEKGDRVQLNQGDLAYYNNFPRKRLANPSSSDPLLVLTITSPPTTSLDEMIDMRQAAVKLPIEED